MTWRRFVPQLEVVVDVPKINPPDRIQHIALPRLPRALVLLRMGRNVSKFRRVSLRIAFNSVLCRVQCRSLLPVRAHGGQSRSSA